MLKSNDVFKMENKLYKSIDPAFFKMDVDDPERTEDDRQIFNAYAAVQGLRLYLEEKEKPAKENSPADHQSKQD